MTAPANLLQFLLLGVSGWLQRSQASAIEYLKTENRMLRKRLGERRVLFTDAERRELAKKAKAVGRKGLGDLENGVVTVSEKGTGQGSVISPLLANVYLHYVFDLWAERWRRHEATGDMILVRYADDRVPRTHRRKKVRNCVRDGGRSSGAGPPCQ